MTTLTAAAPLFAGFAELTDRFRTSRPRSACRMRLGDRDRQRLLDDLRALPDAPADIADRVRVRR